VQGGIGRNEWVVSGVFYAFFRSCRFSEDSTSWQHTFSSALFLFCFIFKVHNFFSNCLSRSFLYPNLTLFFYSCKFSKDNISQQNTFSSVLFLLALHLRYIDCFQIIKLWTVKLAKCFFLKNGGPAFDLCLCDQKMFIACLLCRWPLYKDHTHLVCVEHDTDVADRHIARGYVNLEVILTPVVMVINYEVMLLCFQSLTPFCF